MPFFSFTEPSLRGLAADETQSPPRFVIVGDFGVILYSVGVIYQDGFRVEEFEQPAVPLTWRTFYDVAFGNGRFIIASESGAVYLSYDGMAWELKETSLTTNLLAITYVASSTFVAVGEDGYMARTVNLGTNWTYPSRIVSNDLLAVAANGAELLAVGASGKCLRSTNSGASWSSKYTGVTEDLRGVVYGPSGWVIVGDAGTILETVDGSSFTERSSPIETDFYSVAWSGGLLVAVGANSDTITSTTGEFWEPEKAGVTEDFLYCVRYLNNRYVGCGSNGIVIYSLTGSGRPSFDVFYPISDQYRSIAFAQFGAYMLYVGMREFEENEWNYYPRRIRNPAPASVDDFESVGHFFADLPGKGALLDAAAVRGGIVLAESDQLSLLTDGGSVYSPWAYQQKYGEGLRMISNLCSLNGMAYGIAKDGLIYQASVNGVERLPGFFDLTKFDDFNPSSEAVWIGFDAAYQCLFVFRPASPYKIFLVNDDTGGVSELQVPELTIDSHAYVPLSCFSIQGEMEGLHVSYATDEVGIEELVVAKLDVSGGITGIDTPDDVSVSHVVGKIETGSFRLTSLGVRGDLRELLIRTWADPDSTVRPDIAVRVREEAEDDWMTPEDDIGTITVATSSCTGVGTTWSRYIAIGDDIEDTFTLPWLVAQCDIYLEEIATGDRTAATYTETDDFEIQLSAALATGYTLYVNPGPARPFVKGEVGDYIESDEGFHRITAVNTAYDLELDWYPSQQSSGKYIPAQAIPAGDAEGEGRLVFGVGRGFDQIMIQILILAHQSCDAVGAKILELELGYQPTGPEMETDNA